MSKKKKIFRKIPWFKGNSDRNLAKNLLMAKFFAEDGHPKAQKFLKKIQLRHIDAMINHGFDLIGLDGYGPAGYPEDMLKNWKLEADLEAM